MKLQEHWNNIFTKTDNEKLGWWEDDVSSTTRYLEDLSLNKDSNIFIAGVGTSLLVDRLIGKYNANFILNDISNIALEKIQKRLGNKNKIEYFHHDLSKSFENKLCNLWIDRAVLHFLVDEKDIDTYFDNIKKNTNKNAYVLFAQFRIGGATSCASLDIKQYSIEMLNERLGEDFELINSDEFDYVNPFGNTREYIYTLYKKK